MWHKICGCHHGCRVRPQKLEMDDDDDDGESNGESSGDDTDARDNGEEDEEEDAGDFGDALFDDVGDHVEI